MRLRPLLLAALALLAPVAANAATPPSPVTFPAGFIFGTATAAVQVEGGTVNSDWESFEERPGAIRGGDRIGEATRYWDLYEQDFEAARQMHTNGYRCSIEWSRLEPRRGVWDEAAAQRYRAMFASLRAKGIRPMVTLHHFSNPQWVADQGGWVNPQTVDDFEWFVERAAVSFGDQVDDWLTFNEPTIYTCEGYIDGGFPPGRHGDFAAYPLVLAHLAKAHGRAYHALHRLDVWSAEPGRPPARVGVAEHMVAFEPQLAWNPLDGLMAFQYEHWMDYSFLDACTTGQIRFDTFWRHDWEDVPWLAHTLDFVGVNYYTRSYASALRPFQRILSAVGPKTDLGLDIVPDGMYDVLTHTYARYHLPVDVTETGVADARRTLTPAFMVQHLARVSRAIKAGVPVEGIYWWSLLDNFEWQNGYHGRFGLLGVDFTREDRRRTWTPAAHLYARFAGQRAIDPPTLARYSDPAIAYGAFDPAAPHAADAKANNAAAR